jgi:hypothetical protein
MLGSCKYGNEQRWLCSGILCHGAFCSENPKTHIVMKLWIHITRGEFLTSGTAYDQILNSVAFLLHLKHNLKHHLFL